ncbi:glycoside hydrolase family 1 protein [Lachnospiraceae bacterium 54-53]
MSETVRLPEGFFLGAAASAWQTEGWKGKKDSQDSYIDRWYKENREVWYDGYGPAMATDFIKRYKEDIFHMKEIGIHCYRTSLNWSRFLVDYEKVIVDEEYAAYYSDMIDECVKNGVTIMVCLEHYEVPYKLMEQYGGWNSRHVVDLFVCYAKKAFEYFGDKVKYWFVFNEPVVVQTRVYLDALRWPFHQDSTIWMQWNYNKALATARVMEAYKKSGFKRAECRLGTIINVESAYARSDSGEDQKAAYMYDLFYNKVFLDPALKGRYEEGFFDLLKKYDIMVETEERDEEIILENQVDWVGINLYHPNRVKFRSTAVNEGAPFHPNFFYEEFDLPGRKMNAFRGWEIYPKIIYDFGMRMKSEYGNKEWFVAESGMGVQNENQYKDRQGMIQDDYRIDFIRKHLYYALKAAGEGSNIKGYMLWAFTDNVSPMNAFKNRYGLIEIDLEDNRNRHLKKSAYFYKKVIEERSFEYEDDGLKYR